MHIKRLLVFIVAWVAFSTAAYAQEAQADAARQAPPDAPASEQKAPYFDVWEYRVQGNTLLERQDIERAVYPFMGKDKSIQDIEKARQALQQRYRDAGYATVLVNIPQQKVQNGVVRLKIVEGTVGRLLVSGSRYFSLQRIRDEVPSLAEGKVPHLPTAQEQLAALNSVLPDRSVTPVLRPGKTPGTVEVDLKVKDELPLHGSLELNDRYSTDTSRLRLSAMLRYDNLWQKEHSFSLQYQTAPEKPGEVKVWSGTYLARSDTSRNILAVYGVHSTSDTATVGTLAVIGKGDIVGARWIKPFGGSRKYSHNLTLGLDYKDFKESIVLQGADSLNTPISYMPWVVQYSGTRRSDSGITQFGVGANFGIRGLMNDTTEFDNKRYNARPNYIFLRANLERDQNLYWGMLLRAEVDGQLSDSPLISNEQFSAGGADSVRGYHESERLGDDAVHGTLELHSPLLRRQWLQDAYALLFFDGAALRVKDPLPAQESHFQLYSAGIGLRFQAWDHLNAAVDLARPLKSQNSIQKNDDRIHFSVEHTF